MSQHEITARGPLLDGQGALREAGWARRPLLEYRREDIVAPLRRIKEWDYYCVLGEHFGLACTIADLGYMGMISVSVLDFNKATHVTETFMLPFPLGGMQLSSTSERGDIRLRHNNNLIDFSVLKDGGRILKLDFPGFAQGVGLRGAIVLQAAPGAESIVMATPWKKKPRCFYYNQKINCLAAEGVLQFGTSELVFAKDKAFAVLDWGRGVWPYASTWYWGSASGLVDGHQFGFNIGYGFGDLSAATENAVFLDGKLHKLGSVTFHINPRDYLMPWRFTSDDDRLEMTLEPAFDRSSSTRLVVLSSSQHQVFGMFTGRVTLDDGSVFHFRNLTGFAERVKNRW